MKQKKEVTLDPKTLREECLSFGLFISVCQNLISEQKETLDEQSREGILLLASTFLYGNAVANPPFALYLAALAYEERQFEDESGNRIDLPPWHEGEESEVERYADTFFALYSLFLATRTDVPSSGFAPSDYLGPLEFFSGAIKEDIDEAMRKCKGDPHYDAFHTEITSYPFSLDMKGTAMRFYLTAHPDMA